MYDWLFHISPLYLKFVNQKWDLFSGKQQQQKLQLSNVQTSLSYLFYYYLYGKSFIKPLNFEI